MDSAPKGPSVGDRVILNQPVFFSSKPSKVIGTSVVTVTYATPKGAITQDQATVSLPAGQLAVSGLQNRAHNPFWLAITGGTGQYQNARGEVLVHLLRGAGSPAAVTVYLIP